MVRTLVIALVLTSFFTFGGISLVTAGEVAGLPFAVGGAVLQIAAVALVGAARGVSRSLESQTVARPAMVAARRRVAVIRRVALGTVIVLFLYGVTRLVLGDPWSLVTAALIGFVLFLFANGIRATLKAHDQALAS